MALSNLVKGVLSLVGAFCLHFMNGSLYSWSNLNQYFASYLKHNGNPNIVPEDTSFLMPCIFLVQYCFMTIGVKLGNRVGARFSTLIGILFMYGSYAIMIFSTNYYLVLIAMGIFGLGDGLANLSVITNCWKYFPNNKALINGIIIGGLGISSAVLTPIADYFIINPRHVEPDESGIYPVKIANHLLDFLYFLAGFFLVLGILAVSLTFNYKEELVDEDKYDEKEFLEKNVSNMKLLCEGFWSIKNLILGLFCFCGPFACFLITNTYRILGNRKNVGQDPLYLIGILFGIVNGSTRFIWGYLMDKFNFKILMIIISIIEMTICCSIYFVAHIPALFVVENLLVATCLSGTFTTITPLFNKVFKNLGAEMYGLTGFFIGLASFLGPILTKLLIKEDSDYIIIYFIGAGICLGKFIALFFFDENSEYVFKSLEVLETEGPVDIGGITSNRPTNTEES